ncbi:MAG: serine protease Do [Verrucomicrobiales bacterium]|jgi:serine protease Do
MRHGLGRSLIVLAVFAVAFLVFGVFLADRDSQAGLIGLIRKLHGSVPTAAEGNAPQETFTLASPRNNDHSDSILVQIDKATSALVESVMPSVVRIDTTRKVNSSRMDAINEAQAIGRPYDEPGLGSGVFISVEGHVMTNYHVVAGVDEIAVTTWSGSELLATLMGFDADMDVALLKVENPHGIRYQPLPFGDSDDPDTVDVGYMVMAVGSPMGLTNSVTTGIVSGRYSQQDETTISLFVTTAIINPGSSGGPLINSKGELVGINTALYAVDPAKRSSWQGIGLATPSNEALNVFYKIRQAGHQVGYIGVRARDLPAAPITRFGAEPQSVVMVTVVTKGSPAESAGVLPGDVVLSFAARQIHSTNQLFPLVREHAVGESVSLVVFRGNEEVTLEVVVASQEEFRNKRTLGEMDRVGRMAAGPQDFCEAMGVHVGDFTSGMRRDLQILPDSPGILVKEVDRESQLAGELQRGDIIERLDQSFIFRAHDFHEKINNIESGVPLTLWFKRDGDDKSVTIRRIE